VYQYVFVIIARSEIATQSYFITISNCDYCQIWNCYSKLLYNYFKQWI